MADSIKSSQDLSVGIEYRDTNDAKKTAYFKIPNYKANLTEQNIRDSVGAAINTGVFLISDMTGDNPATISADQIYTAFTTNETINDIDIDYDE